MEKKEVGSRGYGEVRLVRDYYQMSVEWDKGKRDGGLVWVGYGLWSGDQ